MMISEKYVVARKHHECGACETLRENIDKGDLTFSELRTVAKAKANKWQIVPGQRYYCQVNVREGRIYSWKAIPEIDAICERLKLYEYFYE